MERFVGKTALVTGASSGIGLEIAKHLVKKGVHVVGLARRLNKLEELRDSIVSEKVTTDGKFYPYKCDVSNTSEIEEAFRWIATNIGPVSILVNNAGVIVHTYLSELEEKDYETIFDTNVKAILMSSKLAIQSMTENKVDGGHIVNINSMLGQQFINKGSNSHLLYTVTKHTLTAINEALRREITTKRFNVKVSGLNPGQVETTFSPLRRPNIPDDEQVRSEHVAKACIAILDTPPLVLIPELSICAIHAET